MTQHLDKLREIGKRAGEREMLVYLNDLTEHRFTAMYRFDVGLLKSVYFYDSEQPELVSTPDIPVMASYCVFVRDTQNRFSITDSQTDERVVKHPKRLEVRSYCGVPLVDAEGRVFGTICHFDTRPLPISDENVALMEALAPILSSDS